MKKLSTSVSPFLMLFVPVLLFAGLSFTLNLDSADIESTSSFSTKSVSNKMVNAGQQSLIKFLLKK